MMMYLDKTNTDQTYAYLNFHRSNVVVSATHCVKGREDKDIKFINQKTGIEYKLFK